MGFGKGIMGMGCGRGDFFRGGWNYVGWFLKFSSLHRINFSPHFVNNFNIPPKASIHLMVVI